MAILLGLITAIAFGASDFAAGLGGRSIGAGRAALIVQVVALGLALVGTYFSPVTAQRRARCSGGLRPGSVLPAVRSCSIAAWRSAR